jgi:hypothetical protein
MVRLPHLTSDDLEHFDDARLDDAYEEKLFRTGDDLSPIGNAVAIVEKLLGVLSERLRPMASQPVGNGSMAGAAPAFETSNLKDKIVPKLEAVEMPKLAGDPTETELLEYAGAHPAVRTAMRVFRAKIVDVKKIETG